MRVAPQVDLKVAEVAAAVLLVATLESSVVVPAVEAEVEALPETPEIPAIPEVRAALQLSTLCQ